MPIASRAGRNSRAEVVLECLLCPHHCVLKEGETGTCRSRRAIDGNLVPLNYGKICAQAVDQIEKKPIYHYRPGSKLLSIGTFGCNLDCDCCQNAALALSDADDIECINMSPQEIVDLAMDKEVQGIAFTFNEPIVWYEFILDVSIVAHEAGLFTMMNTNGFIEREPLKRLASSVDVFNVDVKSFADSFYDMHCKGRLAPVLKTCEHLFDHGNHIELAYLIIPGYNDGQDEIGEFFRWVNSRLSSSTPVHLYRFMPAHRFSHLPPSDIGAMRSAKEVGISAGSKFVYLGGMVDDREHNTYCPRCGTEVIRRTTEVTSERVVCDKGGLSKFCPSYDSIDVRTVNGRCQKCGENILFEECK